MLRFGTSDFYNADGLGSIMSVGNTASALAQTYTFDSFGKQTASTGSLVNPFQYTAREKDSEAGLYYYRARYYDSNVGRFLNEDPVEFQGGVNFYRYALDSPIVLRDPSGLCPPKNDICKASIFQPEYLSVFSNIGRHLQIDPHFIMALAVQESGWNLVHVYGTNKSSHGKPLNNLFGSTYAGGDNIAYPSVGASANAWEKNWGPELADHPSTIEDFTFDLTQNPKHMYNDSRDWPGLVEDRYRDLLRHLKDCNITLPKPQGD